MSDQRPSKSNEQSTREALASRPSAVGCHGVPLKPRWGTLTEREKKLLYNRPLQGGGDRRFDPS